jgi:Rrf2 family nitric oxide-sensitive transcriptional repressor
MRLLASTDIALRVLMLLGRQEPGYNINVVMMASQLGGLSRNHLHKIVQDLAALGIVRTVRGAGGGVALAKPLSDVRLGELVRTLESDQAIVECFRADSGNCALDSGCRLRAMLRTARECFYESLDQHTLADCAAGRWFAAIDKSTPKTSKLRANA